MEEIRGVLEAQLEDDMADFSKEDFKKMKKEDSGGWYGRLCGGGVRNCG